MKKPKVCFLGTTYNGQAYIAETIECILNQTIQDIEVIYINDGSTDHTIDILKHYAKIDPRFKYYSFKKNKGISKAWNYGLTKVTAPIICVTSDDDTYIAERAELSHERLHNKPYDVFYGAFLRGHEDLSIQQGFLRDGSPAWIAKTVPYKKGILKKKQTIGHGFMSITTKMALKVKYRENLKVGIDYPFLVDLENAGCRFCWTKDPLGIYRLHPKSVSFTRYDEVLDATREAHKDVQ